MTRFFSISAVVGLLAVTSASAQNSQLPTKPTKISLNTIKIEQMRALVEGNNSRALDADRMRAIIDFLHDSTSIRADTLPLPVKPNEPLRGQKPPELPSAISPSAFRKRGANDVDLTPIIGFSDGTSGTLVVSESPNIQHFSPAHALIVKGIAGRHSVIAPPMPNEPLRGQKPKVFAVDFLDKLGNDPGRTFITVGSDVGSSIVIKRGANDPARTVVFEPDGVPSTQPAKPGANEPAMAVIFDAGHVALGKHVLEARLDKLRAIAALLVLAGDGDSALGPLEELIAALTQERDRLSKDHQQMPERLAALEKIKNQLGQAHLTFGLMSQVGQARREVARLEAEVRAGRTPVEALTRAREKLALHEQRLAEARGE